jgi:hypothetical protein
MMHPYIFFASCAATPNTCCKHFGRVVRTPTTILQCPVCDRRHPVQLLAHRWWPNRLEIAPPLLPVVARPAQSRTSFLVAWDGRPTSPPQWISIYCRSNSVRPSSLQCHLWWHAAALNFDLVAKRCRMDCTWPAREHINRCHLPHADKAPITSSVRAFYP